MTQERDFYDDDDPDDDIFPGDLPTPEGAVLLDNISAFLGKYIAYPSNEAKIAHTLWIAHTHLMEAWESTPRIAFLSPEPESGKTRALEVTELLVPRPVEAVNVTPSYLFRKIGNAEGGLPTILFDEIDTVFGPKAKENEEIRGLLNAGHRRGAVAGRCVVVGKKVKTEEIPAFCAVALAGIGDLPDTILSRCVVIRMRRRAATEEINPFRRRLAAPDGMELHDRLADWAEGINGTAIRTIPEMPPGVTDRSADVWEALLAVAQLAGGAWPQRARDTAVTLVTDLQGKAHSLGVQLLQDMKTVMGGETKKSTSAILSGLYELDESIWKDMRGKALTDRGLASRLGKYNIEPKVLWFKDSNDKDFQLRGYDRADFEDAWKRYCVSPAVKA